MDGAVQSVQRRAAAGHTAVSLGVRLPPVALLCIQPHSADTDTSFCSCSLTRSLFLLRLPRQGHRKFITSIAWEPAHVELPARRFVTGSRDNTIKVWDANTR